MKHALFFILISFALTSCYHMDTYQMESIDYSVLKYENADFSAAEMFYPIAGDFLKYYPFLDKKLTFRITAISYPTVDPNGNPIEASGLVFHPLNKKSKGVIDFMPSAHIDNYGGGTDEMYAVEGLLSMFGYTIILPDLIGSGISKDSIIPFMMVENNGRVAWDMHRAAAQYLWDEFRYTLPHETIIMGYSLGGNLALSAQKYYETYQSQSVKVKEVHAGGGVYDLSAAFSAFARTGFTAYPAIPKTILAFNHYYHLGLDFSQVFTGDLLVHYEEWFSGVYKASELMDWMSTDMHAYMHPDFFKPFDQQNTELKRVQSVMKENSVSEGWRPKAPIYMTHSQDDGLSPLENAEAALKKLRKAGANVSFSTYPGNHENAGIVFFIKNILRFTL